jgi:hypothetical protein
LTPKSAPNQLRGVDFTQRTITTPPGGDVEASQVAPVHVSTQPLCPIATGVCLPRIRGLVPPAGLSHTDHTQLPCKPRPLDSVCRWFRFLPGHNPHTARGECHQLLGEITRGSWGICMAQGGDVHAAPPKSQPVGGPASRTESRESDSERAGVASEEGQVGHQAAGGLRAEVEDDSGGRSVGESSDQESGEEADITSSISGLGAAQVFLRLQRVGAGDSDERLWLPCCALTTNGGCTGPGAVRWCAVAGAAKWRPSSAGATRRVVNFWREPQRVVQEAAM